MLWHETCQKQQLLLFGCIPCVREGKEARVFALGLRQLVPSSIQWRNEALLLGLTYKKRAKSCLEIRVPRCAYIHILLVSISIIIPFSYSPPHPTS